MVTMAVIYGPGISARAQTPPWAATHLSDSGELHLRLNRNRMGTPAQPSAYANLLAPEDECKRKIDPLVGEPRVAVMLGWRNHEARHWNRPASCNRLHVQ